MELYDRSGNRIENAKKGLLGNHVFTLDYNGRQIASLSKKYSLKPKYEIPAILITLAMIIACHMK